MSHILDRGIEFDTLKSIVETASSKSVSVPMLEENLNELIPKEKSKALVNTEIKENGIGTAMYVPQGNYIKASAKKVEKWLEENTDSLKDAFFIKDVELFRGYLYLYCLSHEVEHAYQELIAYGNIELNNPTIQKAYYHILRQFIRSNNIIPRPIKETRHRLALFRYRLKENSYVLERNASLEGYDLLYRLANYSNNQEMANPFYCCRSLYCKLGYHYNTEGSFAETYQAMLMKRKYKEIFQKKDYDPEEAVHYGLPVSEETRQKILTL